MSGEVNISAAVQAAQQRDAARERERAAKEAKNRRRASAYTDRTVGIKVAPFDWISTGGDGSELSVVLDLPPLPPTRRFAGGPVSMLWKGDSTEYLMLFVGDRWFGTSVMVPPGRRDVAGRPRGVCSLTSPADLGVFLLRMYPGIAGLASAPIATDQSPSKAATVPAFEVFVAQARAELEAYDKAQGLLPEQMNPPLDVEVPVPPWLPICAIVALAVFLVLLGVLAVVL